MASIPQRGIGVVLLGLGLLSVVIPLGMTGLMIMGAAWMVSSLAKSWLTPNQALMMALMGPVVVSQLGLAGNLARVLGL
jgi:hypothetical protein